MNNNLKHICFDKDGVLIDVHKYWVHTTEIRSSFLKKKFNLNLEQANKLSYGMGIDLIKGKIRNKGPIGYKARDSIIKVVADILNSFHINIKLSDLNNIFLEIDEYQRKNNDYKIIILDTVKDFFRDYHNKYSFSIFTSDRKLNAILAIKKINIFEYIKEVIGGDSVNRSKPDPQGLLKICKKMKLNPKNIAYISDTCTDLVMAKNAGLKFKIGILTGLGTAEELNKHADLVCKDLKDLKNYI